MQAVSKATIHNRQRERWASVVAQPYESLSLREEYERGGWILIPIRLSLPKLHDLYREELLGLFRKRNIDMVDYEFIWPECGHLRPNDPDAPKGTYKPPAVVFKYETDAIIFKLSYT